MTQAPLADVRVVLAGASRAARMLARLLADQGASCVVAAAVRPFSVVDAYLDRGMQSVAREELDGLRAHADVWITDQPAESPGHHGLITAVLTPVHAEHPLYGDALSDAAIASLCGLHQDPLERTPRYTGFRIPAVLAALYGANAVMAALLTRKRDGRGQTVTISVLQAALQAQELVAAMTHSPPSRWPSVQWAASPWVTSYAAGDGRFVYVHAGLPWHLCALLDALVHLCPGADSEALKRTVSDATRKDPTEVPTVAEARESQRRLRRVFAQKPALFWETELSARGLCAVMVRDVHQWSAYPQAIESGAVAGAQPGLQMELAGATPSPSTHPLKRTAFSDVAAQWPVRARDAREADGRLPLHGVTVLDLSQIIAGPVAARTLWELGADVVRVENPRLNVGFASAFHALFNAGKRSITLDLTQAAERDRLFSVVTQLRPAVLLRNWRGGVAEKLGLVPAVFSALNAELVDVHVTAYGTRGPWAQFPGWEQTAQAATGMQHAHGGEERPLLFPAAVNDLATGLFASLGALCALYRGGPASVSCALSSTATLLQMDAVCGEPAVPPRTPGPRALERFYKTSQGWALLSVPPSSAARLTRVDGLDGFPVDAPDEQQRRFLQPRLRAASVEDWRRRFEEALVDVTLVEWAGLSRAVQGALVAGQARRVALWDGKPLTVLNQPMHLSRTPLRETPPPTLRGNHNALVGLPPPSDEKSMPRVQWLRRQAAFGWYMLRQKR